MATLASRSYVFVYSDVIGENNRVCTATVTVAKSGSDAATGTITINEPNNMDSDELSDFQTLQAGYDEILTAAKSLVAATFPPA